jgi:riboflavin synthase
VFTGLVEGTGRVVEVQVTEAGRELRIEYDVRDLTPGESIAVNGACLTVRDHGPGWFTVGAVVTTLGRTTIGDWDRGTRVNLERAMKLGDRLGGHLVQGHVDGVATVVDVEQQGDARLVTLEVPDEIAELCIPHGSITVDGVSLTVNAIPSATTVGLSLIEYTLRHTTLRDLQPGDRVHVEGDMIGKYVRQLLTVHRSGSP